MTSFVQYRFHGRAVQVDPIKPTLKAPGLKRFKLKYDKSLSILLQFCFQIQLAPLHHGIDLSRVFAVPEEEHKIKAGIQVGTAG